MKVVGSIQARLGSSRLPGKVLKEILGKPMLLWQVERLRRARLLDEIIVATTTNPDDDRIAELCRREGILCYRGPEDDVLARIAGLIRAHDVAVHVEFFGDSPLTDAQLVDEIVGYYLRRKDEFDYVSNSVRTTYPPGQEVIVYAGAALLEADRLTPSDDPMREHTSIHLTRRPELFRIQSLEAPPPYRCPDIYLEVDTPEDFDLITRIVGHFAGQGRSYFSLAEILDFLRQNPELPHLNDQVHRRWKRFRQDGSHV